MALMPTIQDRLGSKNFFVCPACGKAGCAVTDSRPTEGGIGIRRRRICTNCSHRFTTREAVDLPVSMRIDLERARKSMQNAIDKIDLAFGMKDE